MKFITEFLPLLLFFLSYKTYDLYVATSVLIFATTISVTLFYFKEKKIAYIPLISAIILGVFGGLTIFNENEIFIKLKPTIVNLVFATILLGGALKKKGLLKYLLGAAMTMPDHAWIKFSVRWGFFFIFLALLNEIIWRMFSTDFWVQFKVFGMLPLTIAFTMTQLPFMMRYVKEHNQKKQPTTSSD